MFALILIAVAFVAFAWWVKHSMDNAIEYPSTYEELEYEDWINNNFKD